MPALASTPFLTNHAKTSARANRTTSQITSLPVDVVLWPIHTQIAFITPVWFCEGSRAWYMKRQMIPAPMNEIAIGRKIKDLAVFSAFARSASTATARPSAVASDVTTMTHQMLFMIVPRIEANTAHDRTKSAARIGPTELGPRSKGWLVRRPASTPMMMPRASKARAR